MPEVRLIGADGNQIGIVKTPEALSYAQERDLDLVEVAPEARPPVCRVLDYSKYKYEQAQKQKAARRHQQQITVREIKFRPKIAQNDYDTKKGHVSALPPTRTRSRSRSCSGGARSRIPSAAPRCSTALPASCRRSGSSSSPRQDGRNMTMLLAPSKAILAGEKDKAADGKQEKTSDGDQDNASDGHELNAAESNAAESGAAESNAAESQAAEPQADSDAGGTAAGNGDGDGQQASEPVEAGTSSTA